MQEVIFEGAQVLGQAEKEHFPGEKMGLCFLSEFPRFFPSVFSAHEENDVFHQSLIVLDFFELTQRREFFLHVPDMVFNTQLSDGRFLGLLLLHHAKLSQVVHSHYEVLGSLGVEVLYLERELHLLRRTQSLLLKGMFQEGFFPFNGFQLEICPGLQPHWTVVFEQVLTELVVVQESLHVLGYFGLLGAL